MYSSSIITFTTHLPYHFRIPTMKLNSPQLIRKKTYWNIMFTFPNFMIIFSWFIQFEEKLYKRIDTSWQILSWDYITLQGNELNFHLIPYSSVLDFEVVFPESILSLLYHVQHWFVVYWPTNLAPNRFWLVWVDQYSLISLSQTLVLQWTYYPHQFD